MNFADYMSKLVDKVFDVLSMGRVLSVVFPGLLVGAGFVMLLSVTFAPGVASRAEQLQSQAAQQLVAARLAWGDAHSDSVVTQVREALVSNHGRVGPLSDSLRQMLVRIDTATRARAFGPLVGLLDSLARYVPADERIAAGQLSISRNWLTYQGAAQIRRDFEHVSQLWFVVILLGIVLGFLIAAQGYTHSRFAPWMVHKAPWEHRAPWVRRQTAMALLLAVLVLVVLVLRDVWPELLRSTELSPFPGLPLLLLFGACFVWAMPHLRTPAGGTRAQLDEMTTAFKSTLMKGLPVMDYVGEQKRDYLAYITQEYYRFSEFAFCFPEALFWFFMTVGAYFTVLFLKGLAVMVPSVLCVFAALLVYALYWFYWLPQVAGPNYLKYKGAADAIVKACEERARRKEFMEELKERAT